MYKPLYVGLIGFFYKLQEVESPTKYLLNVLKAHGANCRITNQECYSNVFSPAILSLLISLHPCQSCY